MYQTTYPHYFITFLKQKKRLLEFLTRKRDFVRRQKNKGVLK
ncbi:hypothetical protein K710_0314 [Streptococcus iniae SF1]|nr:hypothetical protein K710_0314 [Streptococcus iniae SF1]